MERLYNYFCGYYSFQSIERSQYVLTVIFSRQFLYYSAWICLWVYLMTLQIRIISAVWVCLGCSHRWSVGGRMIPLLELQSNLTPYYVTFSLLFFLQSRSFEETIQTLFTKTELIICIFFQRIIRLFVLFRSTPDKVGLEEVNSTKHMNDVC